jgi:GT2 family glycosyltransferase
MVRIATITLNWNNAEETLACVNSLLLAGAQAEHLFVVENGSSDDSLQVLRENLPNLISLIANPTNQGFAAGNNLAIQQALSSDVEWLFLINNDTRIKPDLFKVFSQAINHYPQYQIFAPLIFYYDDPTRIWSLGDRLIPGTLITRSLLRNRILPKHPLPETIPVDFLNACALLVHRKVFETVGLFNPDYFMYAEDVDFCWRARQAGFHMACISTARIWHRVSWSAGVTNPRTRAWQIGNQIRFYRLTAKGLQRPLMFGFTGLRTLLRALVDTTRGQHALAKTTIHAWWQGWFSSG